MRRKLLIPIVATVLILAGLATATYWHHKNDIITKHEKITMPITNMTITSSIPVSIDYGEHFEVSYRSQPLKITTHNGTLTIKERSNTHIHMSVSKTAPKPTEYIRVTLPKHTTMSKTQITCNGLTLPDGFCTQQLTLKNNLLDTELSNIHADDISIMSNLADVKMINTATQTYHTVDAKLNMGKLTIQNANITNYHANLGLDAHEKHPNTHITHYNVTHKSEDHDE